MFVSQQSSNPVFVSMCVKAVHLEVVTDEAFLSEIIARRGLLSVIYSDNGTNFVGANNELKQPYDFFKQEDNQKVIADTCSQQMIEWKFIPERSPHFGGLGVHGKEYENSSSLNSGNSQT